MAFVCYLFDSKNIEKKLSTLLLISQEGYSVKKITLQCNTCSHAISYSFFSALINSISVSCILNFLEFFYNNLKANKSTLQVCIMHYKSHLNVYNMKKQTQKYACVIKKTLHCIFSVHFKKEDLTLPFRKINIVGSMQKYE